MTLFCPNCRGSILHEHLDLNRGGADCIHCDHTFALSRYELRLLRGEPRRLQDLISKPSYIKVVEDSDKAFKFGYRLFDGEAVFSLIFGAGCLFFSIYITFLADIDWVREWRYLEGFGTTLLSLFAFFLISILPALTGLALVFKGFAWMINRTLITADHEFFTIHNGLIPYQDNHRIAASQLKQFYAVRKTIKVKYSKRHYHLLYVILEDDKHVRLLWEKDPELVVYVEQQLERFYNISNQPIEASRWVA